MKWYNDNSKNSDVVISSRIRLARNLSNYPFSSKLSETQAANLVDEVNRLYSILEDKLSTKINYCSLSSINSNDKIALVERHVISPELVNKKQSTGILVSKDEKISVMINEEEDRKSVV